jgi:hypothetical protein
MCVLGLDSDPLFCALLDHANGGAFTVAPEAPVEARQRSAYNGIAVECVRRPNLRLHLRSHRALTGLDATHDLQAGERLDGVLSWGRFHRHHALDRASS